MTESAPLPDPAPEEDKENVLPEKNEVPPSEPLEVRNVRRLYIAGFGLSALMWVLAVNPASFLFGGIPFGIVWYMRRRLLLSRVGRCGMLIFAGGSAAAYARVSHAVHFETNICSFCDSQLSYLMQWLMTVALGVITIVIGGVQRRKAAAEFLRPFRRHGGL